MDSFQQIGIAIIFGFIIYLVYFYYNKYTNKQKENFEVKGGSKTDAVLSKLTTAVPSQHDILLISKYRSKYESIIICAIGIPALYEIDALPAGLGFISRTYILFSGDGVIRYCILICP